MAPYKIKTRLFQTKTDVYFQPVEKVAFNYGGGGTWKEEGPGVDSLFMGDSGTSGLLRFKTEDGGEAFLVALGVHNYKPWVDIVTNLDNNYTGVVALPEYYAGASAERCHAREAQRTTWSATNAQNRKITAQYKVADGHVLDLDIIIG